MEKLKLNFDTVIKGENRTYIVEVPYKNGIVATSEFCPPCLLSSNVDLMAAIRGESLDKFIKDCRMQIIAMSNITETTNELDRHIGGLMATVMEHFSRNQRITFGDLLSCVDCFCILLKAAGFNPKEIHTMYPHITRTILDLYPDYVLNAPDLSFIQDSQCNLSHQNY